MSRDTTATPGWISGGVVAVAVILGVFMMTGRNNTSDRREHQPQSLAGTVPVTPVPVQAPSTTYSATPLAPAAR